MLTCYGYLYRCVTVTLKQQLKTTVICIVYCSQILWVRNLGRTRLGSVGSCSTEVAVRPWWPEQIKGLKQLGLSGHLSFCGSSCGLGGAFSQHAAPGQAAGLLMRRFQKPVPGEKQVEGVDPFITSPQRSQACQDSRGRNIDSTFWWQECQSHRCVGDVTVIIFGENHLPHKWWWILSFRVLSLLLVDLTSLEPQYGMTYFPFSFVTKQFSCN